MYKRQQKDSVKIRRKAVELAIPCLTSLDTADALANSLKSRYTQHTTELVDINHMRKTREAVPFVKMVGCGNDYILSLIHISASACTNGKSFTPRRILRKWRNRTPGFWKRSGNEGK